MGELPDHFLALVGGLLEVHQLQAEGVLEALQHLHLRLLHVELVLEVLALALEEVLAEAIPINLPL